MIELPRCVVYPRENYYLHCSRGKWLKLVSCFPFGVLCVLLVECGTILGFPRDLQAFTRSTLSFAVSSNHPSFRVTMLAGSVDWGCSWCAGSMISVGSCCLHDVLVRRFWVPDNHEACLAVLSCLQSVAGRTCVLP